MDEAKTALTYEPPDGEVDVPLGITSAAVFEQARVLDEVIRDFIASWFDEVQE